MKLSEHISTHSVLTPYAEEIWLVIGEQVTQVMPLQAVLRQ